MNTQLIGETILNIISQNPWLVPLMIWSTIWKMIALWKSAKNNHLVFFIVVMFLNTVGILEICYILYLYYKNKKEIKAQL
ncbi:MAG: DUF5652 family protein [Candidatus Pacebacteria bacterium]|nr:DUF5652 family protein [Candidatus Paceibacterota bacterium]